MTTNSTFTSSTALALALSLGPLGATACGGSDPGTAPAGNGGAGESGAVGSGGAPGPAGSNASGASSTGGAADGSRSSGGSSSGGAHPAGSGTGNACNAGSSVQAGGADTCPRLAWRCVDESIGNPPFHLVGVEGSTGHAGGCCSYSDKCLTNTDGSPSSQSAVEVAVGPCQAGCIANPSAQACLDCINANLASAGLPALSSGCGTCWTNLISCSFTNCLGQCVAGATAPGCRQCAFENCVVGAGKFNECSGLLSNAGL